MYIRKVWCSGKISNLISLTRSRAQIWAHLLDKWSAIC